MANVTHRQSFDQGILDADALLLMKVNMNRLPARSRQVVGSAIIGPNKIKESDMVWFEDGYITMESPRDAMLSQALIDVTKGYALALVNGKILKTYAKGDVAQAYEDLGRVSTSIELTVDLDGGDTPTEDE